SRGCPYQCAFCATNYDFRTHSFTKFKTNFQRLVEIVEKYNNKYPKIGFADQSFNRVLIHEKILDYIIEKKLNQRFIYSCQSRVETLSNNPGLIEKFQQSKMIVGLGFETANSLLLKEMHKTMNPKHYLKVTKLILAQYREIEGIHCRLNVLCGFPGETKRTFNETIDFIKKYGLYDTIQISPTLFSNYPNVFVYKNMEYYRQKFGSKFNKKWWKNPENPYKNAVPKKCSKNYPRNQLIFDYKEKYAKLLQASKINSFAELITWKRFYNNWCSKT
ncbi:MAG: radical SAM protein, partial [Candidatus Lokiarchaeota archaeon]|nr:radical SAM protein [Candidatus Lokiarchaeota archaeon]MBD3339613.1 radical SAM protein [Candidatus Lokiarchaeota archaeon]